MDCDETHTHTHVGGLVGVWCVYRALCWWDEAFRNYVNSWLTCPTTPVTLSTWSVASCRSISTAASRHITVRHSFTGHRLCHLWLLSRSTLSSHCRCLSAVCTGLLFLASCLSSFLFLTECGRFWWPLYQLLSALLIFCIIFLLYRHSDIS